MLKMILFNYQFNNSISMINMNKLNDLLNILMMMIILMILIMIKFNFKNNFKNKIMLENNLMEMIWTIIPILLILMISYISIFTLYLNNEFKLNSLTIKITGNQWFWSYNYINLNINFNSYLLMNNLFKFNLIETDNKLILPMNYQILLIISSSDVIHSWTIPSLNIKIDAIPNQINSMNMLINKINILFGQCSEICGINHSFMPIQIESISFNSFLNWIK